MAVDRTRLAKLMGMTTSDHDGEALNALRMANRMLSDAKTTWEQVLQITAKSSETFRTPPSKRGAGDTSRYGRRADQRRPTDNTRWTGPEIDPMLSAVAARRLDLGTMAFIASINEQWERKGFLTTDQYNALKRIHAEADDRGGGRGFRF